MFGEDKTKIYLNEPKLLLVKILNVNPAGGGGLGYTTAPTASIQEASNEEDDETSVKEKTMSNWYHLRSMLNVRGQSKL